MLAFDTETGLITRHSLTPPLVCLSLAWTGTRPEWLPSGGEGVLEGHRTRAMGGGLIGSALLDRRTALAIAPDLLRSPRLVAANAPFDLAVLAAAAPATLPLIFDAVEEGGVRDVQVRERLLAVARGDLASTRVSLASLVRRYLGRDIEATKGPDTWRTRYIELIDVPLHRWPSEAVEYAVSDACYTLEVCEAQGPGTLVSEDREVRAAWALHLMAVYGVRADPGRVDALAREWGALISAGQAAGVAGGWVRTTPARQAGTLNKVALQAVISSAFGGDPPRTEPTSTYPAGQVKTDAETLDEAAERMPPGALRDNLVAYRDSLAAAKASSVWLDALDAATEGPLVSRPCHLVETGRTSWSDPPWQQPPRKGGVRECVVPRPGFLLCSVDYHVAELCALAQVHLWWGLSGELADALNAGVDLHLAMAAQIERVDYAEAVSRYAARDAAMVRARQLAKVANFGFPGGLGPRAFVAYAAGQGVTVTLEEARALKATWLRTWPAMRGYFDRINRLCGERGSFSFEHPVSGRIRGSVGYCDGCNGPFQGLVGDGAKDAAYRLSRAAYTGRGHPRAGDFRGSRPILFIHDEIIAEVPEGRAHEAAEAMAEIMVDTMREYTPDVVARAEPALMRRWYKQAATVRDASGRLVPWEPG